MIKTHSLTIWNRRRHYVAGETLILDPLYLLGPDRWREFLGAVEGRDRRAYVVDYRALRTLVVHHVGRPGFRPARGPFGPFMSETSWVCVVSADAVRDVLPDQASWIILVSAYAHVVGRVYERDGRIFLRYAP